MGNIFIERTKRTPQINFLRNGELSINGSSIAEDAVAFYSPLIKWFEELIKEKEPDSVIFNINIEYINTSSVTCLIKLLKLAITSVKETNNLKIVWKFDPEDEDSYEQGELIQKIIQHPVLLLADHSR